jgi:hypothetical protein
LRRCCCCFWNIRMWCSKVSMEVLLYSLIIIRSL